MADTPTVALEGPCCAGKTSLTHRLVGQLDGLAVALVRCYADHVGGGRLLPRQVPESVAEDVKALDALLQVEAGRLASTGANAVDLVLMDRSVHTLLAHRWALEWVTGLKLFAQAQRVLAGSDRPAWPDLVLYLDLPQEAVHDRNHGKFAHDNILIDAQYNTGFRSYFAELVNKGDARVVWLDAMLDPAKLLGLAEAQIMDLLRVRDV